MRKTPVALFLIAACAHSVLATRINERKYGIQFIGALTRSMQNDDVLNPGMLSVKDGEAL